MIRFPNMTLLAAIATIALSGTAQAQAQPQTQPKCFEHGKILSQFASVYKEAPVAAGLTADGRLIEVLSSDDGFTWTLIVSKPDGESCVIMAGEGWRKMNSAPEDLDPGA